MDALVQPSEDARRGNLVTPAAVARLQSRIERFTVDPAAAERGAATTGGVARRVVLTPPGAHLRLGFERARDHLRRGELVRLVGHGVTLEHEWPAWVADAGVGALLLTELGAYVLESRMTVSSVGTRDAMRTWLARCFRGTLGDLAPDDVLLAWSLYRLGVADYDPSTYTDGLLALHARDSIEIVDERWIESARFAASSAPDAAVPTASRLEFAVNVIGRAAVLWPAAVGRLAREYVAAQPAMKALRERRSSKRADPAPAVWTALLPSWPRMNAHLLQHVRDGEPPPLGFLFFGTLRSARKKEHGIGHVRARLFEGLDSVLDSGSPVDQLALPESTRELALVVARAAVGSLRALKRVVLHGPRIGGPHPVNLGPLAGAVARLVTVDIVEAHAGDRAADGIARRYDLVGKPVVFATASPPAVGAACWRLAAHGAIVTDYHHGFSTGAYCGGGPYKCLWALPEVEDRAPLGEHAVVAGMPPVRELPRRAASGPARVLLMTSYAHRDGISPLGAWPWLPFQQEMLAVAEHVEALGLDVELRWRPHPADLDSLLEPARARFPSVACSRGAPLESDLEWADVVVTSVSTSMLEALALGRPVFVQLTPEFQDVALTRFVSPERAFFRAKELARLLAEFVHRWRSGDDRAFAPDRQARAALFGPSGQPASLFVVLQRLAEQAPPIPRDSSGTLRSGSGRLNGQPERRIHS